MFPNTSFLYFLKRMKKYSKVKNPCKICFHSVTAKTGLRCLGACKTWVHYKCLQFSPDKIQDIKAGILKIKCPCPNCESLPNEITERPNCGKFQCPANKIPVPVNPSGPQKFPTMGTQTDRPVMYDCPADCPSFSSLKKSQQWVECEKKRSPSYTSTGQYSPPKLVSPTISLHLRPPPQQPSQYLAPRSLHKLPSLPMGSTPAAFLCDCGLSACNLPAPKALRNKCFCNRRHCVRRKQSQPLIESDSPEKLKSKLTSARRSSKSYSDISGKSCGMTKETCCKSSSETAMMATPSDVRRVLLSTLDQINCTLGLFSKQFKELMCRMMAALDD